MSGAAATVSLPGLVAQRAETHSDDVALSVVETGARFTWSDLHDRGAAWADMLYGLGVRRGDVVSTMLAKGDEAAISWIGTASIGALDSPTNHGFTGEWLRRTLDVSRPKVAVIDARFAAAWGGIAEERDLAVVTTGPEPVEGFLWMEDLLAQRTRRAPFVTAGAGDPAAIIFTSGTTGRSKGVIVPWGRCAATLRIAENLDPDGDGVYYNPFPPFHWSARGPVYRAAARGTGMVSRERFKTTAWLDDIRQFGCTDTLVIGAMIGFLMDSPPHDDDRDNPLRACVGGPLPGNVDDFAQRFGIQRVVATYGMSEIANVFLTPAGETATAATHQSVGKPAGIPIRIMTSEGSPAGVGAVGELQVGGDQSCLNLGYLNNAEATREAWTPDGWFKTGDLFRQDEAGQYFFVDRLKDAIRRRGENISSSEVEEVALGHPSVQSCAVVAVPSEWSEDEVMIFVTPDEGTFAPSDLVDYLRDRLPSFAMPRYVEFIDELPYTPTMRVQKVLLRERGLGGATWDAVKCAFVSGVDDPSSTASA